MNFQNRGLGVRLYPLLIMVKIAQVVYNERIIEYIVQKLSSYSTILSVEHELFLGVIE